VSTTKRCPGCKNVYELSAFSKDKRSSSGLQTRCKACQSAYAKPKRERGNQRALKAKLDYGKCDCHGIEVTVENHRQFEWDHLNPSEKKYDISQLHNRTDKLFYEELSKCRLVCRSFHIEHSRQQRLNGLFGTKIVSIQSLIIQKPIHQDSLFGEVTQ
jgi:hypothetical protein